jgi:alpha-tubulin suppressor-like RCC1 family protein
VATSVSVGRRHSLVLSDSGMLMGFGGLEGRGMPVFAPVPSTRPHPDAATRVAAVASGAYFCVILTTTGQVHLLGNLLGTRVRTPLMHRRVALEPTAATTNDDKYLCSADNDNDDVSTVVMVSAVAAGDRHALLLTGDGRVFGLGSPNGRGQARRGEPSRDDAAYEVTGDRGALAGARARVRAVAAGSAHSVALTTDGRLWAFGCDRDGQCGVAAGGLSVVALPRLLTSLVPTSAVAAGGTRTYALLGHI